MKLLGWMHGKFRQNDANQFIDFTSSGHTWSCLLSWRPSSPPLSPIRDQRFFGDDGGGEEHPAELFLGLLAIGTLGTGPIELAEPRTTTPTYSGPSSWNSSVGKESKAMESNLKAVTNVEPEKVLFPELEKHDWLLSDSVSGKQSVDWHLQGNLSGSPVETANAWESVAPLKRTKQRTSLGELFSMAAADGLEEGGEEEQSSTVGMKRIRKRRPCNVPAPPKGSRAASGVPAGSRMKSKLQKIMQIFHRKVHPDENSMATAKKSIKSRKHGILTDAADGGGGVGSAPAGTMSPARVDPSFNCQSPAPTALTKNDSSGKREYCWIRTDEEYLVLEL